MTPIFYHPTQEVISDRISLRKVPEFVRQSGRAPIRDFRPADANLLKVTHSDEFVDGVLSGKITNGFGNKDPEVLQSILHSNGNILAAVRYAIKNRGVVCSATQGFHHAHFDNCYGYCTFNGLTYAIMWALPEIAREHALIIDGDAHHGDGTDDIIYELKVSQYITNVTSDTMRHLAPKFTTVGAWREYFADLIHKCVPGIIVYQAGADAWDQDPMGAGYLTRLDMMKRNQAVFLAAKEAGVPIVWNLAGGYTEPMQETINLHLDTLRASDEVFYGRAQIES